VISDCATLVARCVRLNADDTRVPGANRIGELSSGIRQIAQDIIPFWPFTGSSPGDERIKGVGLFFRTEIAVTWTPDDTLHERR